MLRCYFYGLSEIYDMDLYEKVLVKLDDIIQRDERVELFFS